MEDGTTLNKYSTALMQVGINIKDQNGELKTMDTILDEMGNKWKTLNQDQKLALAQTVAGTRQYNQLVALMDNWDFMQRNIETASAATGTLTKQQEIYMDSIGAQLKEFTATVQGLYTNIFNSEMFKSFINIGTGLVETIDRIVSSFDSGIPTILAFTGALSGLMGSSIGKGLNNIRIKSEYAKQLKAENDIKQQVANTEQSRLGPLASPEMRRASKVREVQTRNAVDQNLLRFTSTQEDLGKLTDLGNTSAEAAGQRTIAQIQVNKSKRELEKDIQSLSGNNVKLTGVNNISNATNAQEARKAYNDILKREENIDGKHGYGTNAFGVNKNTLKLDRSQVEKELGKLSTAANYDISKYEERKAKNGTANFSANKQLKVIEELRQKNIQISDAKEKQLKKARSAQEVEQITAEILEEHVQSTEERLKVLRDAKNVVEDMEASEEAGTNADYAEAQYQKELEEQNKTAMVTSAVESVTSAVTLATTAFASFSTVYSAVSDAINGDITWGEALVQSFTTLGMLLPMVIQSYTQLSQSMTVLSTLTKTKLLLSNQSIASAIKEVGCTYSTISADKEKEIITKLLNKAQRKNVKITEEEIKAKVSSTVVQHNANVAQGAGVVTTNLLAKAWKGLTAAIASNPLGAILVALTALIPLIMTIVKHVKSMPNELDKNNAALESLQKRYENLTTAVQEFKQATSDYDEGIKALEDLTEGTDEYKKKLEETNDKARELIETYGLFNKFKIVNGVIVIEPEAIKGIEEQNNQKIKDAEAGIALRQGRQDYLEYQKSTDYDEAIESKNYQFVEATLYTDGTLGEIIETDLINTEKLYKDVMSMIQNGQQVNAQSLIEKDPEAYGNVFGGDLISSEDLAYNLDRLNSFILDVQGIYDKQQTFGHQTGTAVSTTARALVSDEISDNSVVSKDIAAAALGQVKSNREALEKAYSTSLDANQYNTNKALSTFLGESGTLSDDDIKRRYYGLSESQDLKAYEEQLGENKVEISKMREELVYNQQMISAMNQTFNGEESKAIIDAANKANDDSVESKIISELIDSIAGGEKGKIDISPLFSKLSPEQVLDLENKMQDMDDTELAKFLGIDESVIGQLGTRVADKINKAFQDYDPTAYWEARMAEINKKFDVIDSAQSSLSSGKELDSEQISKLEGAGIGFDKEFYNSLDGYEEKLKYISGLQSSLYDEAIQKQKDYQDELAQVTKEQDKYAKLLQEQYDIVNDENVSEGAKKAAKRLIQVYEKELEKLNDKSYEIHLEIDNNYLDAMDNMVDDFVKDAELMKTAAEMIGEGFKVSKEDVEQFSSIYPELLHNSEILADGSIQLNRAVVQDVLQGKQAEMLADKEVKETSLENQLAIVRANLDHQRKRLAILKSVFEGEKSTEDAAVELKAEAEAYKDSLIRTGAINEEQANKLGLQIDSETTKGKIDNLVLWEQQMIEAGRIQDELLRGESITSAVTNRSNLVQQNNYNKGSTQFIWDEYEDRDIFKNQDEYNSFMKLYNQALREINVLEGQETSLVNLISKLRGGASDSLKALQGAMSGRGGKASEASSKEAEVLEYLEDEIDRYHDINILIEELNKNMERVKRVEETLTGSELTANLQEQIKLLQEQRNLYAQKKKIAEQELGEVQIRLAQYSTEDGLGIQFTEDGKIANYTEVLQARQKAVNDIIAAYNAMSGEEQEAYKPLVEAAKEGYEKFKKDIDKYDELSQDLIEEMKELIEDTLYQEIEIKVKDLQLKIDAKVDFTESEKEWNKFRTRIIEGFSEDDILGNVRETFTNMQLYYNNFGTGQIKASTDRVARIQAEIEAMDRGAHSSIYSAFDANSQTWIDNRAQALEDLKAAQEQLMSDMLEYDEMLNELTEQYLSSIDNISEAFSKQNETYQFIQSQLEHDIKMAEMLYGDDAYKQMADYYQKRQQASEEEVNRLRSQEVYWHKMMEEAKLSGNEEEIDKFTELWQQSLEELNSSIEEWATNITENYKNAIGAIVSQFSEGITNGFGLDNANEELRILNQNAEIYLDTINAAYEVQNLKTKWQEAIDNTDSVSGQKKLNDLMAKQMKMLENKGKLSQKDIERANLEYDLALKQIALEESQQNKSKMRLRRDANGNYSYQFVTDEEAINNAAQELEQAKNQLYNFDKERYNNTLTSILSMSQEFMDKASQIYIDYAGDVEAQQEQLALLQLEYNSRLQASESELISARTDLQNSAFDNLATLYGKDAEEFAKMSEQEKDAVMTNLIPAWNSVGQSMLNGLGPDGLQGQLDNLLELLGQESAKYNDEMAKVKDTSAKISDEVNRQKDSLISRSQEAVAAAIQEAEAVKQLKDIMDQLTESYKLAAEQAIAYLEAARQIANLNSQQTQTVTAAAPISVPIAPVSFDTGGYTGEWGSSGKLAVLHEKELVLNSEDTANLFKVFERFKAFSDNLESNLFDRISSALDGIGIGHKDKNTENAKDTIEQNVHIEATFQDATTASEIETALESLVNKTSQLVYR